MSQQSAAPPMQVIRLSVDRENPGDDADLAITASAVTWVGEWPPPQRLFAVVPFESEGTPLIFDDDNLGQLADRMEMLGETLEDHYVVMHYYQAKCSKLDENASTSIPMARGAEYYFRGVKPWNRPTTKIEETTHA